MDDDQIMTTIKSKSKIMIRVRTGLFHICGGNKIRGSFLLDKYIKIKGIFFGGYGIGEVKNTVCIRLKISYDL